MAMTTDVRWHEWIPSKSNPDTEPLSSFLKSMPRLEAEKIPEIIRKYENPSSPDALPGAITLERHDIIHILLDRGLRPADEAFVIGVTMGAASDFTDEHAEKFIEVSTKEYPAPYAFTNVEISSYLLGVGYGSENLTDANLHKEKFENWVDDPLCNIRDAFGINMHELNAYYRMEKLMGNCIATRRL